jgi:hypothetical protein
MRGVTYYVTPVRESPLLRSRGITLRSRGTEDQPVSQLRLAYVNCRIVSRNRKVVSRNRTSSSRSSKVSSLNSQTPLPPLAEKVIRLIALRPIAAGVIERLVDGLLLEEKRIENL